MFVGLMRFRGRQEVRRWRWKKQGVRISEQESRNSALELLLYRLALWEEDGIGIGYGKHGANEKDRAIG